MSTTEVPEDVLDEVGRELAGLEADEASADLNILVRRYVALHVAKQEADAAARKIGADKAALEEILAERYGLEGVQNVKLDGHCVSRKKETFVSLVPESKEAAIKMLEAMGFSELVTVNHNSLRARVKEWIESESMPEAFAPMVKVTESYGIAVRKG